VPPGIFLGDLYVIDVDNDLGVPIDSLESDYLGTIVYGRADDGWRQRLVKIRSARVR
jgi:hypothetical protein